MTDDPQSPDTNSADLADTTKPKRTSKKSAKQKTAPRTADFPDFSESVAGKSDPSPQSEPRARQQESDRAPQRPESDSHEISLPETVGGESQNAKRKRRRKRGKGNPQQNEPEAADPIESNQPLPQQTFQPPPRPKLDSDMVAKRAWKIYLSEVSEEGVALVSDQDAKELTRRCFRLAEIFLEEQARRR